MEKEKVLNDETLKQIYGGFEIDFSRFSVYPNFFCHTTDNFIDISPAATVNRISDGKRFVCLGFYNNANSSTTYVFAEVENPSNTIMFVADANNQTLIGFHS